MVGCRLGTMMGLFHVYAWDHDGVVSCVCLGPWWPWGCFMCMLGTMMGLFHVYAWDHDGVVSCVCLGP